MKEKPRREPGFLFSSAAKTEHRQRRIVGYFYTFIAVSASSKSQIQLNQHVRNRRVLCIQHQRNRFSVSWRQGRKVMTKLRLKIVGLSIAVAAAVFFVVPSAQASPVNYVFQVTPTSGPLLGTVSNGSFTYDTNSIVVNGYNEQVGLLTAFNFNFYGHHYDASTGNTGYLGFDAAGDLTSFVIGNDCGYIEAVGYETCEVRGSTDSQTWNIVTVNESLGIALTYSTTVLNEFGYGDVTFSRVDAPPVASVPEPGVLGMFGLGALLIGGFLGRRRRIF